MADRKTELLAAIHATDDDQPRLIYADWLEERGIHSKAEYIRLQDQLHLEARTPTDALAAFAHKAQHLRDLAVRFSEDWRRQLARPVIEKCDIGFELECPVDWSALPPGESPTVRHCSTCDKAVHYCKSIEEARGHAYGGRCVALDLVAIRRPGDLETRSMRAGRMLPR